MRAVIVSVDYSDLLQITLPRNIHHFSNVTIVTTPDDHATHTLARSMQCDVLKTDLFYANGARFNKFRALEYALDIVGRYGWLCLLDADIVLPAALCDFNPVIGKLYSPLRKWWPNVMQTIPEVTVWDKLPYIEKPGSHCFAGYTQIFHADDPVLINTPWHRLNYDNASDGDTDFSRKWVKSNRVRTAFDVLHLGDIATNWCGRATAYADGTIPRDAESRVAAVSEFLQRRKKHTRR